MALAQKILLCAVTLGYGLLAFRLLSSRLAASHPVLFLYASAALVQSLLWSPYGGWRYEILGPLLLALKAGVAVEAFVKITMFEPAAERGWRIYVLAAVAGAMAAVAASIAPEATPVLTVERWRRIVHISASAFCAFGWLSLWTHPLAAWKHKSNRLKWNCALASLYVTGDCLALLIDYRRAPTVELRWHLYYLQSVLFLGLNTVCLAAWWVVLIRPVVFAPSGAAPLASRP